MKKQRNLTPLIISMLVLFSFGVFVMLGAGVSIETERQEEKDRADSLQALLNDCSECCNAYNKEFDK